MEPFVIALILMFCGCGANGQSGQPPVNSNDVAMVVDALESVSISQDVSDSSQQGDAETPGESNCYYIEDWAADVPSGKSEVAGGEVEGPGFFVPLRGKKAFWPHIQFVHEGSTFAVSVPGVSHEYEPGLGCDLDVEVEYTPAAALFPIGG